MACCATPARTEKEKDINVLVRVPVQGYPIQLLPSLPVELKGLAAEHRWREFVNEVHEILGKEHSRARNMSYMMLIVGFIFMAAAAVSSQNPTRDATTGMIIGGMGIVLGALGCFFYFRQPDRYPWLQTRLCQFIQVACVTESTVIFELVEGDVVKGTCRGCPGERTTPNIELTELDGSIRELDLEEPKPQVGVKKAGGNALAAGKRTSSGSMGKLLLRKDSPRSFTTPPRVDPPKSFTNNTLDPSKPKRSPTSSS